jgi:hypothetical protein
VVPVVPVVARRTVTRSVKVPSARFSEAVVSLNFTVVAPTPAARNRKMYAAVSPLASLPPTFAETSFRTFAAGFCDTLQTGTMVPCVPKRIGTRRRSHVDRTIEERAGPAPSLS